MPLLLLAWLCADATALVAIYNNRPVRIDEVTVDGRAYVRLDDLSLRFQTDMSFDLHSRTATLTNRDEETLELAVGSTRYMIGDQELNVPEEPVLDGEGNVLVPVSAAQQLFGFLGAEPARKVAEAVPVAREQPAIPPVEPPTPTPVPVEALQVDPTTTPQWVFAASPRPLEEDEPRVEAPVEQDEPEQDFAEQSDVAAPDAEREEPPEIAALIPTPPQADPRATRGGIDTVVIDIVPTRLHPGARGAYDVVEYEICRSVAEVLATHCMRNLGLNVVFTIEPGAQSTGSVAQRMARAAQAGNAILISLQAGAAVDPEVSGFSVYYMTSRYDQGGRDRLAPWALAHEPFMDSSRELAETIFESLHTDTRLAPGVLRGGRFSLFRALPMPAVLVELGVVTSPVDARYLRRPEFRQEMGTRLATGIGHYLEQ